ncbi:MAG: hypothetical protein H8E32_07235 [Nitrospinae bacterium]|nr:hypothetical protein [Nitrospinota bacterium]
MSKVFLHIGYPKTATTTLQRHLFSTSNNLLYLGKPFKDKCVENWINEICYNTSVDYSSDDFRNWFKEYRNNHDFPIFLSHEGFLMPSAQDLQIICERIIKVFGNCKIVLTLRNQWEIASSFYYSAGLKGLHLFMNSPSIRSFPISANEWVEYNLTDKTRPMKFHHKSFFSYLDFNRTIDFLNSKFGKENISILLFENFIKDKNLFINNFEDILGCKFSAESFEEKHENKTFYGGMNLKAYLDRLYLKLSGGSYAFKQKWDSVELFKSNLKKEYRVELEEYFSEANKKLQEKIDTNLKDLGYSV